MRGSIAIPAIVVTHLKTGYTIFDVFSLHLDMYTKNPLSGWYAYKLEDEIYYFLWCDSDDKPSKKHLEILKKDGYNVGITHQVVEDLFKE